ncbi:hypothetical protein CRENBAI_022224, partial [Crenichthys baileyi]
MAQCSAKSLNVCRAPVKPETSGKPTTADAPVPAAPRGSQAAPAKGGPCGRDPV